MGVTVPAAFPSVDDLGASTVNLGGRIIGPDPGLARVQVQVATWCYASAQRRRALTFAPHGADPALRGHIQQADHTTDVLLFSGIYSAQAGDRGRVDVVWAADFEGGTLTMDVSPLGGGASTTTTQVHGARATWNGSDTLGTAGGRWLVQVYGRAASALTPLKFYALAFWEAPQAGADLL